MSQVERSLYCDGIISRCLLSGLLLLTVACGRVPQPVEQLRDRLQQQTAGQPILPLRQAERVPAGTLMTANWVLASFYQEPALSAAEVASRASELFSTIDPVWGAMLEYPAAQMPGPAVQPAYATRLVTQARAMQALAMSYQVTGERRFQTAFDRVEGYLQSQLRTTAGVFAAGQAVQPEPLRSPFTAASYWQLPREHDRRQLGLPEILGEASAGSLLALGQAYVLAADGFGDPNFLVEAQRLAEGVSAELGSREGPGQTAPPNCEHRPQLLRLTLDLYQRTADQRWLQQAQSLQAKLIREWASTAVCTELSEVDGEVALAYIELALATRTLAIITAEPDDLELLEPLLIASQQVFETLSPTRRMAHSSREKRLRNGFVAVTISGQLADPRTQALLQVARRTWQPGRTIIPVTAAQAVELSLPESPAAYVCSATQCAQVADAAPALRAAIVQMGAVDVRMLTPAEQVRSYLGLSLAEATGAQ